MSKVRAPINVTRDTEGGKNPEPGKALINNPFPDSSSVSLRVIARAETNWRHMDHHSHTVIPNPLPDCVSLLGGERSEQEETQATEE